MGSRFRNSKTGFVRRPGFSRIRAYLPDAEANPGTGNDLAATYLPRKHGEIKMDLIKPEEITRERMIELLSMAGMIPVVDADGDIYIKEGLDFGTWLIIDKDRQAIKFLTSLKCKADAPRDELDGFANRLNTGYFLVKFMWREFSDGAVAVNGNYELFYPFGVVPGQLTHALRKFSQVFISAIRAEDKEDKFFG
jgi:hypothetical protein